MALVELVDREESSPPKESEAAKPRKESKPRAKEKPEKTEKKSDKATRKAAKPAK
jgi:hypothetical protein